MYPINIIIQDEITIKDFADEIIKLTGTTVVYFPLPINDPATTTRHYKSKRIVRWEAK
jgi:dTDP-glucose 4,6-dehydratase